MEPPDSGTAAPQSTQVSDPDPMPATQTSAIPYGDREMDSMGPEQAVAVIMAGAGSGGTAAATGPIDGIVTGVLPWKARCVVTRNDYGPDILDYTFSIWPDASGTSTPATGPLQRGAYKAGDWLIDQCEGTQGRELDGTLLALYAAGHKGGDRLAVVDTGTSALACAGSVAELGVQTLSFQPTGGTVPLNLPYEVEIDPTTPDGDITYLPGNDPYIGYLTQTSTPQQCGVGP